MVFCFVVFFIRIFFSLFLFILVVSMKGLLWENLVVKSVCWLKFLKVVLLLMYVMGEVVDWNKLVIFGIGLVDVVVFFFVNVSIRFIVILSNSCFFLLDYWIYRELMRFIFFSLKCIWGEI